MCESLGSEFLKKTEKTQAALWGSRGSKGGLVMEAVVTEAVPAPTAEALPNGQVWGVGRVLSLEAQPSFSEESASLGQPSWSLSYLDQLEGILLLELTSLNRVEKSSSSVPLDNLLRHSQPQLCHWKLSSTVVKVRNNAKCFTSRKYSYYGLLFHQNIAKIYCLPSDPGSFIIISHLDCFNYLLIDFALSTLPTPLESILTTIAKMAQSKCKWALICSKCPHSSQFSFY